ncbi:2-hydroxymuconate tautomerase [Cupriavidus sp. 2MCAB6]|uniref:2-hydroxymuconate tautomerase n=1 Tax=Cupriavidus sp. 2MCAB6 TaxID=3232981 RepID=UPI003F93A43F
MTTSRCATSISALYRCASSDAPGQRDGGAVRYCPLNPHSRRRAMPIMQVFLIEGRTEEQKARLISALTDAAVESIGAPIESVRVMITEVPKTQFGIAGKTAKELGR